MQVQPDYEYSALPTDDTDTQSPIDKFSPQKIFTKTIGSTIHHFKNGKIETSTNVVDEPLLNDTEEEFLEDNNRHNSFIEKFYYLISKCNCNDFFKLNYFFD